jgi:adenosylhomocysteinase
MATESTAAGAVRDLGLAADGVRRIEWAAREMPVVRAIRERFIKERPLEGVRIAACLHVTTETANLMLALKDGGADVRLCASNPLSTQDETAAALMGTYGIPTFAIKGEDNDTYYSHLKACIERPPQLTMDDGCDLVALLHKEHREQLPGIIGGTEETTTGVVRLKSMAADRMLAYPVIAINDADTKHFFDNRYGTGQSTMDGITRATNILWAGRTVVIAGYGWCGRGLAMRAKGAGSHVIVTEVDPIRAIEAVMDGYQVMPMIEAARRADIVVTVTGDVNVVDRQHLEAMKDGAIIANSGHFNSEINIEALHEMSETHREMRPFVEEYRLGDGRVLFLLAEGRLVNLSAAEGHPASVMDMSFANQALSVEHLVLHAKELVPNVYEVPKEIDREVARLKLASMGMTIDTLTAEQEAYLSSWESGT